MADPGGMAPIHISYLMDETSYLEARRAHAEQTLRPWLRWPAMIMGWLGGILMIFVSYILFVDKQSPWGAVLVLAMGLAVLFANTLARHLWRQQYKKVRLRDSKYAYTFDPEFIQLSTPMVNLSARWEIFLRLAETRGGFLLYAAPNQFHWLPRSAFRPDDVEPFVAMARGKIPFRSVVR